MSQCRLKTLRRNPPEVRVTSRQKPSTPEIIYIVLQTSVRLF